MLFLSYMNIVVKKSYMNIVVKKNEWYNRSIFDFLGFSGKRGRWDGCERDEDEEWEGYKLGTVG